LPVVVDKNGDFRAQQENDVMMWMAEINTALLRIKKRNSTETYMSLKLYIDTLFSNPSLNSMSMHIRFNNAEKSGHVCWNALYYI
jgi:hypothetical protein